MLAAPIQPAIPAEALFPSWRGREPYAERLQAAGEALRAAHPGLADAIAALPFERFEAACDAHTPVHKYNEVPAAAAALAAALAEELRAPWLCALVLWHIHRFDPVFAASGLDGEFALHYADAFHRIIGQIEADPDFADLGKDSFLKDLWLARAVMIPAFAQVWWPRSGLAARDVLRAGPAAASYVFLRCGGRRPFLEGHTHDPVARAYWNEPGWGEALRLAALALPALRQVRGAFGTAWFYDPAIREISPRIGFAQDLQIGRGAFRLKVGSNDAAIANATATSAERRNRYREGLYLPTDYSIIWSRRDLIAAYGT
ncbi:MAG: hypothetical protein QOH81_3222 [Sphingomonadales bacterium]|jgi:hypothetical protein|nr:hypothetical protein [Sphingomonadales bacterium]